MSFLVDSTRKFSTHAEFHPEVNMLWFATLTFRSLGRMKVMYMIDCKQWLNVLSPISRERSRGRKNVVEMDTKRESEQSIGTPLLVYRAFQKHFLLQHTNTNIYG